MARYPFFYLGVSRSGHHLVYGPDGFGAKWIPRTVQRIIVMSWNNISCSLFGHDPTGEIPGDLPDSKMNVCSACCKELPL